MTRDWTIEKLQELALTSLQFTYNADSPDTLLFQLKPEHYYTELPLAPLDRLTVRQGNRIVFSGVVPLGATCAAQAAEGETVSINLQSDYYILDHTVYAKLNKDGKAVFARTSTYSRTTTVNDVCSSVSSWLGDYLPSSLRCDCSARIPTPTSNGTAPCSALLGDAMRWVPDSVMVQRYGVNNTLLLTKASNLEELRLDTSRHLLQSVSFQPRTDIQVPVCALVGDIHQTWPSGADIRTLGAFVYAVPLKNNTSAGNQKMIVKGVPLPRRRQFLRSVEEFKLEKVAPMSDDARFLLSMFPEYAPFITYLSVGSVLVNVVSKSDFIDDLEEDDEDSKIPENYDDKPETWEGAGFNAIFVHTEGSFPAASTSSKNVSGLKWCKASLSVVLGVIVTRDTDLPKELHDLAQELFPGRRRSNGERWAYVRKTLTCNLIDKRRKVYNTANANLCAGDADYKTEQTEYDEATRADYISAMEQYFVSASKLQHEGNIELKLTEDLNPAAMTGRLLRVNGLRSEWARAEMNSVVRSVSWDYQRGQLSLTTGPRSTMGFDELLERRLLARNRSSEESQRMNIAFDNDDEEGAAAEDSALSISPSITAGTDKDSSGRWHKPFTLYFQNGDPEGTVFLAGGVVRLSNQLVFNIEDTDKQIIDGKANGGKWVYGSKVKIRRKRKGGELTFDIVQ